MRRAMRRAAAEEYQRLARGRGTLDSIVRTAPLFCALSVFHSIHHYVKTYELNRYACVAGGPTESFVILPLGFAVAILAKFAGHWLRGQCDRFRVELGVETRP